MKKMIKIISVSIGYLMLSQLAIAKPAPTHYVSIDVVNTCSKPITIHVDNNWGSAYTGNYDLSPNGSKDKDGVATNRMGFIGSSSNDEEYYTISYKGASCKVDYPLIRDRMELEAVITGCDGAPKCSIH